MTQFNSPRRQFPHPAPQPCLFRSCLKAICVKGFTITFCGVIALSPTHQAVGIAVTSVAWLFMEAANEMTVQSIREELKKGNKQDEK
ncbi:hypothetical protein K4A83_18500 [Spirulina subsalsa FACHB-351]|uniref:Uncharacterized protein n=1 Tax=Spirulina subsalsa FACHB-351 TaxID=234711 RepID=A0ABT3L9S1_9CYAN|nr:hypothetical protein [Spirulina subsalsa]MCW6038248.1 hypothetical protein [Spirulina subsalsa FACHB-351]